MGCRSDNSHVSAASCIYAFWRVWNWASSMVLCCGNFLRREVSVGVEQQAMVLAFDRCNFTHPPSSDSAHPVERCLGALVPDLSTRTRRFLFGPDPDSPGGEVYGTQRTFPGTGADLGACVPSAPITREQSFERVSGNSEASRRSSAQGLKPELFCGLNGTSKLVP